MQVYTFLQQFVHRGCPVLLADAPKKPSHPIFLSNITWVDFCQQDPDPLKQLIWDITGQPDYLV